MRLCFVVFNTNKQKKVPAISICLCPPPPLSLSSKSSMVRLLTFYLPLPLFSIAFLLLLSLSQYWVVYRMLKALNTVMSLQSPLSWDWKLNWMLKRWGSSTAADACHRRVLFDARPVPVPSVRGCEITKSGAGVKDGHREKWEWVDVRKSACGGGWELNRVTWRAGKWAIALVSLISRVNDDEWGVCELQLSCIYKEKQLKKRHADPHVLFVYILMHGGMCRLTNYKDFFWKVELVHI